MKARTKHLVIGCFVVISIGIVLFQFIVNDPQEKRHFGHVSYLIPKPPAMPKPLADMPALPSQSDQTRNPP